MRLDNVHKTMISVLTVVPSENREKIVNYLRSAEVIAQMLDCPELRLSPFAYYHLVEIESAILCSQMDLSHDLHGAHTYCSEIAGHFVQIGGLFS